MHWLAITRMLGLLLMLFSVTMLPPVLVALLYQDGQLAVFLEGMVALLIFGEGWHNNHHAYQRVASQGHRWWEIDMTYWAILLMEKLGLAWNVVRLKDVRKALPQ